MNRKPGAMRFRSFSGGIHPFLPFLILFSIFLPLPFFLLPILLSISLVILSRAAPLENPAPLVRFLDPASPRSPPY
jgi:flagellar biosynthesis component FlhA